ncbi:hypothetical protein [Armatimonas sp.]|uniref:hypothetical protein n=1 Tax=Armatimonas sp. TaxID=1872638 RepID=UPI003751C243
MAIRVKIPVEPRLAKLAMHDGFTNEHYTLWEGRVTIDSPIYHEAEFDIKADVLRQYREPKPVEITVTFHLNVLHLYEQSTIYRRAKKKTVNILAYATVAERDALSPIPSLLGAIHPEKSKRRLDILIEGAGLRHAAHPQPAGNVQFVRYTLPSSTDSSEALTSLSTRLGSHGALKPEEVVSSLAEKGPELTHRDWLTLIANIKPMTPVLAEKICRHLSGLDIALFKLHALPEAVVYALSLSLADYLTAFVCIKTSVVLAGNRNLQQSYLEAILKQFVTESRCATIQPDIKDLFIKQRFVEVLGHSALEDPLKIIRGSIQSGDLSEAERNLATPLVEVAVLSSVFDSLLKGSIHDFQLFQAALIYQSIHCETNSLRDVLSAVLMHQANASITLRLIFLTLQMADASMEQDKPKLASLSFLTAQCSMDMLYRKIQAPTYKFVGYEILREHINRMMEILELSAKLDDIEARKIHSIGLLILAILYSKDAYNHEKAVAAVGAGIRCIEGAHLMDADNECYISQTFYRHLISGLEYQSMVMQKLIATGLAKLKTATLLLFSLSYVPNEVWTAGFLTNAKMFADAISDALSLLLDKGEVLEPHEGLVAHKEGVHALTNFRLAMKDAKGKRWCFPLHQISSYHLRTSGINRVSAVIRLLSGVTEVVSDMAMGDFPPVGVVNWARNINATLIERPPVTVHTIGQREPMRVRSAPPATLPTGASGELLLVSSTVSTVKFTNCRFCGNEQEVGTLFCMMCGKAI